MAKQPGHHVLLADAHDVEHQDSLMKAAKKNGIPLFISPHYYFPTKQRLEIRSACRLKLKLQFQPVILYLFRVEELAEGYGAPQVDS